MSKVILSAFGDETAEALSDQMDVLESCGVRNMELRGVWGKNVLSLTDEEVSRVKGEMGDRGFGVSAIGSPIGKVSVTDDWEKHKADYLRIVDIAKELGTRYIRLFSFFMPKGDDPSVYRDVVMGRMSEFAEIAGRNGLIACHENERDIYGDIALRCGDILRTVDSPYLKAVFDPANFVQAGIKPLDEGMPQIGEYLEYVHIKDAVMGSGKVVPAGQGDGDIRGILAKLRDNGFDNYLTLEPHLSMAGQFAGYSGPELFKVAVDSLKGILDELGIEYR